MRYIYQLIIGCCCFFSLNVYASLNISGSALYWQVTETLDWALTNNWNTSNQQIDYQTFDFSFKPGYRIGVGYENSWDMKWYFTKYDTKTNDSVNGHITSGYLAGKLTQSNEFVDYVFQSGQGELSIDYKMLDWNIGKKFNATELLMLRPFFGIEGGWINQTIITQFQYPISSITGLPDPAYPASTTETIHQHFKGIGPKTGIDSTLTFFHRNNYSLNLIANFASSYLWGHWEINDILNNSLNQTMEIVIDDRNFGSFAIQGLVGVGLNYKSLSVKLGYEFNDLFNQCQVFDDTTGSHNNDLILQGGTFEVLFHY